MIGFLFGSCQSLRKSTNRRSKSRRGAIVSRQTLANFLLFPLLALCKMEVGNDESDLYVSDASENSTSDEEEFEDGFVIDVIDDYDDQTSDELKEDTQPRFGGYEYEFVDEVSDSQKCPVCLWPMRDAVQTLECGHRFCKDCLQRILR